MDDDPHASRFLLTGSATSAHTAAHSGAARIVRLQMRPMTLPERGMTAPPISLAALLAGDAPIGVWPSPKHQLVDPALACALLNLDVEDLLEGPDPTPEVPRDGAFLGGLFESLTALSVRVFAEASGAHVGHLRRRGGNHEIDMVVYGPGRHRVAIEVKLAAAVTDRDVRHLLWLRSLLGDELADTAILTTGRDAYRRRDGVAVVPLALLGP